MASKATHFTRSRREPDIFYTDETAPIDCPYGNVRRVMTGGDYPGANLHVVSVSEGGEHYHSGYDEIYFVLEGTGMIRLGDREHRLRPGAVVLIPAGNSHALKADAGQNLQFIIVGLPGMSVDDPRFVPRPSSSAETVIEGRSDGPV